MPHELASCSSTCKRIREICERRLAFDEKIQETARVHQPCMTLGTDTGYTAENPLHVPLLSKEGKATYLKLLGDQALQLAEMAGCNDDGSPSAERSSLAAEALDAYLSAQRAISPPHVDQMTSCGSKGSGQENGATSGLDDLHPLHIDLAYRISSVLYHFLERPIDAWEAAYPLYAKAAEHSSRLGPRALEVAQLLRNHIASIDIHRYHSPQASVDHTRDVSDVSWVRLSDGWGFLRISSTATKPSPRDAGSDASQVVTDVKHARASTCGVTKVLLGTMRNAQKILSKLEQVFDAYVRAYLLKPLSCDSTDETVWYQGRAITPQEFRSYGLLLSWSGFEVLCEDFRIAPASKSEIDVDRVRQSPQGTRPSEQQKNVSFETEGGGRPPVYLLDRTQALVAFLSACSHGSAVASFPDSTGRSATIAASGSKWDGNNNRDHDEEDNYWKVLEEEVLSGLIPQGSGLSFRQFVDALARCGLIAYTADENPDGERCCTGQQEEIHDLRRSPLPAAEAIQAIFTRHMTLLHDSCFNEKMRRQDSARRQQRQNNKEEKEDGCR